MKTGIGLRPPHYHQTLAHENRAPWLELITENFLGYGGRPEQVLKSVRESHPIAFHGLGLSIGSLPDSKTDAIRKSYLEKLKLLVDQFEPIIVSDHLSWSYFQAVNSHDLLPIPYTQQNLITLVERVTQIQNFLKRKIILENPSFYISPANNEMCESEFFSELCQKSGCGILLDLNNLIINKNNLDLDINTYLLDIQNCSVEQFHLAGHTRQGDLCIDTHLGTPNAEELALLMRACQLWPTAKPLLEWDTDIPPLAELIAAASGIDIFIAENSPASIITKPLIDRKTNINIIPTIEMADANPVEAKEQLARTISAENNDNTFYNTLWGCIFSPAGLDLWHIHNSENVFAATPLVTKGLAVYNSGYFLRAFEALKNLFPKTCFICQDFFEEIARQYLTHYRSHEASVDQIGDGLPEFLKNHDFYKDLGATPTALSEFAELEKIRNELEVARTTSPIELDKLKNLSPLEWESAQFQLTPTTCFLHTVYAIEKVYDDIEDYWHSKGETPFPRPPQPAPANTVLILHRRGFNATHQRVSSDQAAQIKSLSSGQSMVQFIIENQLTPEAAFQILIQFHELISMNSLVSAPLTNHPPEIGV